MTAAPGNQRRLGEPPTVALTNVAVTLVILAIAAALWLETATFERVPTLLAQNIPPEFFPRLALATIIVFALVLPFEPLILGAAAGARQRPKPLPAITWKTAALLVTVALSTVVVGTLLSMILACVLLPALWGERRPTRLIPFALLFTGGVAAVFAGLLRVPFEPGLLATWLGFN